MGYNIIANKYKGQSYNSLDSCEGALMELQEEKDRLNAELQELRNLKQNYEENVCPYLQKAIDRIGSVRAIYDNALNTLLEAEKSTVDASIKLQGKVKVIFGEINRRESEINNMEGLVEGNLHRIINRIARYNIELEEVLQEIEIQNNQYRKLSIYK